MKFSKMNVQKWFLTLAILAFSIAGFSQTTVDLNQHQPSATDPTGSVFEWHNGTPANPSNLVAPGNVSNAEAGAYYGVYYAPGNCYSPESKISVATNSCSAVTVDLSTYMTAANLEWHTNATPSSATKVTDYVVATAGSYFAFTYTSGTYSSAMAHVVVSIASCADMTAPLAPTIDTVTANANGTISVSGTAEPGSTVTVTFPDGTTGTFLADSLGKYGPVTSLSPQTSGTIKAKATDVSGNVSSDATVPYKDTTKPLAPTIDTVTANANGTISVIGTAEPGSTVTVTFPDGTTGTFLVDSLGKYGPVTSATPQTSGTITANAKDVAGNISLPATALYSDTTKPLSPVITLPITFNANGTISIFGSAQPNSAVIVTFPDGTNGYFMVGADGKFGPVTSAAPQGDGFISATATDDKGKVSLPTTVVVKGGGIALIKTGVVIDSNNDGFQQAGETITYSFTIVNTGLAPLINIKVTDVLPGINIAGTPITLLSGEVDSSTYKGTYTISQADIIKGSVSNQASVSGATFAGDIVADKSDDTDVLGDNPTIVMLNGCVIEVFNGMSPNGDGKNDMLYIRGIECYPDNTVSVYNRWGALVFERSNYNNSDIAFYGVSENYLTVSKTKELPAGTYFYVVKYRDTESKNYQNTGYLYINKK